MKHALLVIFDMDGVLIDSELHWDRVQYDICDYFGIAYEDVRDELVGKSLKDNIVTIQKYGTETSGEKIAEIYNNMAEKIYSEYCHLLPGALSILDFLKEKHISLCIGSSSPRAWIDTVIKRFDLKKYFDFIHSVDAMDIPGKPDPAIYEFIMNEMGVSDDETIIIEDSIVGAVAAKASGAFTIAVPDERWCDGDYSFADYVATSLEDVKDKFEDRVFIIHNSSR